MAFVSKTTVTRRLLKQAAPHGQAPQMIHFKTRVCVIGIEVVRRRCGRCRGGQDQVAQGPQNTFSS